MDPSQPRSRTESQGSSTQRDNFAMSRRQFSSEQRGILQQAANILGVSLSVTCNPERYLDELRYHEAQGNFPLEPSNFPQTYPLNQSWEVGIAPDTRILSNHQVLDPYGGAQRDNHSRFKTPGTAIWSQTHERNPNIPSPMLETFTEAAISSNPYDPGYMTADGQTVPNEESLAMDEDTSSLEPSILHENLDERRDIENRNTSAPVETRKRNRPASKKQVRIVKSCRQPIESIQGSGNDFISTGTKTSSSKRRGPLEQEQREAANVTRKMVACIHCHLQKIKCPLNDFDQNGWCLNCFKLSESTIDAFPCIRAKITDSEIIAKASHPRIEWTTRWPKMEIVDIDDWVSFETKVITLGQDVGGQMFPTYSIRVQEFVYRHGDMLYRTWNGRNGRMSHPCAQYAIADMVEAGQTIKSFVRNHRTLLRYIQPYIDGGDTLLQRTYRMALRQCQHAKTEEERYLLSRCLYLWVALRMESSQGGICGTEYLGMTPQTLDEEARNFGKYLIPPVMQAQIEIITTVKVLLPLKKDILKMLQRLIEKKRPQSWFTIYLTMFILFHSCSLLTQAEAARAARHKLPKERFFNSQLVQELHNGVKTMLAFFHYCNKGSYPFDMDLNAGNINFAEWDPVQVRFMHETVADVKKNRGRFEYIKKIGRVDDEFFFISQLFDPDWRSLFV